MELPERAFTGKARDKWLDEAKFRFSIGQSGRAPSGASVYLGAYVKGTDYMNMSATKQARMQLDNLNGKPLPNIIMVWMLPY